MLYAAYALSRILVSGRIDMAYANADRLRSLERVLHIPSESLLQAQLPDWALQAANVYYVSVHFPITIAFLVCGWFLRPRAEYRWARRLFVAVTAVALVLHVVFPLAPPRMMPGFVDTMTTLGPSAYASSGVANEYAAMPSLHIGWAVLIAFVVVSTSHHRLLRALACTHAVVTTLVVVTTANHWWLDGFVAVLILAAGARLLRPAAKPAASPDCARPRSD